MSGDPRFWSKPAKNTHLGSDNEYRLTTVARALGLVGVTDLSGVASYILKRLPDGDAERDLPAVRYILQQILDDDATWSTVNGGHAVVDWQSFELEVSSTTPPPVSSPIWLVSLVLLHIEIALQAKPDPN